MYDDDDDSSDDAIGGFCAIFCKTILIVGILAVALLLKTLVSLF